MLDFSESERWLTNNVNFSSQKENRPSQDLRISIGKKCYLGLSVNLNARVVHMESNVCVGCRFGSVKIKIHVPEKISFQEFVRQTRAFAFPIKALAGQKPIHYDLTFASDKASSKLSFYVDCLCILNVKQQNCSNFSFVEDKNCRVRHLQQKKLIREMQIEVIQTG